MSPADLDPPPDVWTTRYQVWAQGAAYGATVMLVCMRCGPFLDIGPGETLTGCLRECRRHEGVRHP